MRNKTRLAFSFHLASIPMASWVALWLAFILATHSLWCGWGGSQCNDYIAKGVSSLSSQTFASTMAQSIAQHAVHHSHPLLDVCSGTDETRSFAASAATILPPLVIWVTLLFSAFALVLMSLFHQAAIFGRDGPVSVPPLHSRLVRTSLPHRAPPVFLI